jgi:hypothetical protein
MCDNCGLNPDIMVYEQRKASIILFSQEIKKNTPNKFNLLKSYFNNQYTGNSQLSGVMEGRMGTDNPKLQLKQK